MNMMRNLTFQNSLTYPSRPIHWGSAQSLHHRRIRPQEPSIRLQHCSASEGACLPALYCGGHMSRSGELRQSALPRRELPGRTPSTRWWLDSGDRRRTHPWGTHKLHCRRPPGRIWNTGHALWWRTCRPLGAITLVRHELHGEARGWLPVACERRKAACLDVDSADSVGLVLVRWTGLHLGETLIGRDGVDLHPTFPGLLLSVGRLRWGKKTISGHKKTKYHGEKVWPTGRKEVNNRKMVHIKWSWLIGEGNIQRI